VGEFARKLPRIEQRAGLDSATATKGGELKFTQPEDFLEYLYNRTRVREFGAQTVTSVLKLSLI